jgi:UPF0755 protein
MKGTKIFTGILVILTLLLLGAGYTVYNKIFGESVKESAEIFIPTGASVGDVISLLEEENIINNSSFFQILADRKNYTDNRVVSGRYTFSKGTSLNQILNKLRVGERTPIKLRFNEVENINDLAEEIAKQMELKSEEFLAVIQDKDFLQKNNLTEESLSSIFIPNTYEVYWNQSATTVRDRLLKEYKRFWNDKRKAKAQKLGLTPLEVMTLASIVKKETYQTSEYRIVAGLYYNRIRKGMLLQSDPTVIYCLKLKNPKRKIKRVLYKDLKMDCPYNTYVNNGLPPGPISIPSSKIVDAVLNLKRHNYLYMCANATLDGKHSFATNMTEHEKNAQAYRKALDDRKVMR